MVDESAGAPAPFVVGLFGPTGVGKTGVSLELARNLSRAGGRAVVVNCDSIQVYSGLETVSGAPTFEQREEVEHRLVGHVPLDETYSTGMFAKEAHREIDDLLGAGAWPLVVGGTGLYLRAALSDLQLLPEVPVEIRSRIESLWQSEGPEAVHGRLPREYREKVHPNDRKRVQRYLGLIEMGLEPHPDTESGGRLWSEDLRHPTTLVGLVVDRDDLEGLVRQRVEEMAAHGAIEEARAATMRGVSETAGKAIGFRDFAEGDLEAVRRSHLAFAKRQMTWMRRMEGVAVIDRTDRSDSDVAAEIHGLISSGPRLNASRSRPG